MYKHSPKLFNSTKSHEMGTKIFLTQDLSKARSSRLYKSRQDQDFLGDKCYFIKQAQ